MTALFFSCTSHLLYLCHKLSLRFVRIYKIYHILWHLYRQRRVWMSFRIEKHTRTYTIFTFSTCQHIAVNATRRFRCTTAFPILIILREFSKRHRHIPQRGIYTHHSTRTCQTKNFGFLANANDSTRKPNA